jgi:Family of unknown function (DUF5320)
MPRGDRTGPMGLGTMTGRGAGYCAGFGMSGYSNVSPGLGFGAGFNWGRGLLCRGFSGGRRGWRNWFHATGLPGWMRFGGSAGPFQRPDTESEKQALRSQTQALQSELELLKKRLSEMEGSGGE